MRKPWSRTPTNVFLPSLYWVVAVTLFVGCDGMMKKFVENANNSALGIPSVIVVTGGDEQAAIAGTQLPAPITVRVQDKFGNPVTQTNLTWTATGSGNSLENKTTVTDINGQSSNAIQLGSQSGTQSITVRAPSSDASVTANFRVLPAALGGFQMLQIPTSTLAGSSFLVTVMARDIYQNIKTDFSGTVHFNSSDPNSPQLPADYTYSPADQGAHVFNVALKTVGVQTVSIQSAGLTPLVQITSPDISVSASVNAASLRLISNPLNSVAGQNLNSTSVTAVDAFGNAVTGFNGNVFVSIANNPGGGILAGTLVQTCVNGVATFNDLKINAAATGYTLKFSAAGLTTVISNNFNVASGVATSLSMVSGSPQSGAVGQTLPQPMIVVAKDTFGNVAPNAQIDWSAPIGSVSAPTSLTDATGQAQVYFSLGNQGGNQFVTGTLDGTSHVVQFTATAVAGAAASFSVAGFPSSVIAGAAGSVTVSALDGYGNVVTNYTGQVHFTSSDTGATLPGDYTFVTGDSGQKVFPAGVTLTTAATQSIAVTDKAHSNVIGTETGIVVGAGSASALSVSGIPGSLVAGTSTSVQIKAVDAFGNVAKNYLGSIHFTSTDASASLPADYTFLSADAGQHNFTNGIIPRTSGSQTFTATDKTSASITGNQTLISISPAATSVLAVSGFASPATAGAGQNFTVTAKDSFGNITPSYVGTVQFSSNDSYPALLPANYKFVSADNGVHSFNATLKTQGTLWNLVATDTVMASITGNQNPIVVVSAGASTLSVTGFANPATAGSASAFSVVAKDPFGNTASGYVGTVHFTSSDSAPATLPADYTFTSGTGQDNGTHSFSGTFKTSGTQSLTATDLGTGSITGSQGSILVNAGAAATLTVSGFPVSDTAGNPGSVTLTPYDANGNVATGYRGTIHFTTSDGNGSVVLPADYSFLASDNGAHTFANGVTLKTAGTQTITATDVGTGTINGSEGSIVVSSGSTTHLSIIGFPGTSVAGTAGSVTVTAYDASGNKAAGYRGVVHFTSTDIATGVVPSDYTFLPADGGQHVFTNGVTLKTVGTQSISVTDTVNSSWTATQSSIAVSAAAAATLSVYGVSSPVTAGTASNITVKALDPYGNTATGYTGTINFTSSDASPSAALPASYSFLPADNGVHTFTSGVSLVTAGTQSVTATDNLTATITGSQSSITVNPGAMAQITVTTQPSSTYASMAPISVGFHLLDAYGNLMVGTSIPVCLSIGTDNTNNGATLGGTLCLNPSNGIANFTNMTINLAASGYTLSAVAIYNFSSSFSAATSSFNVTVGPAAGLAFAQQPSSAQLSVNITPSISVQVVDAGGNNVATTKSVSLALAANPGGATLAGTLTQSTSVGGLASFSNISLNAYGVGYTLSATSAGLSSATSTGFSISSQALNLQQAIDFAPYTFSSSNTGTKNANQYKALINPSFYNGTVSFTLEINADNSDTVARTINLVDDTSTPIGSGISIPANTTSFTRFTYSFTPNGSSWYTLLLPQTNAINQLNVSNARILISQTGASSSATYIPMVNGGAVNGNPSDLNAGTSWSEGNPTSFTSWTYDATKFVTVSGFVLQGTLSAQNGARAYMSLWDATVSAIVTGSACSTTYGGWHFCNVPLSASSLISGHVYKIMTYTSDSTNPASVSGGGIFVQVQNMTHTQVYYRSYRSSPTGLTSSKNNGGRETAQLDSSLFSSGSLHFQCQAATTGSATISLLDNGATPAGNAGPGSALATPLVASSAINFSSGASTVITSGALSITNGHIYLPYFSVISGTLTVTDCYVVLSM